MSSSLVSYYLCHRSVLQSDVMLPLSCMCIVYQLPAEDIAEDTSPPPPGEGSPVTEYVRRKRAQTFDQGLISERIRHRPSVPAAGAVSSPIRRNASMRYDTGRRLRRKKLGVMDDEGIVSSVSVSRAYTCEHSLRTCN